MGGYEYGHGIVISKEMVMGMDVSYVGVEVGLEVGRGGGGGEGGGE